MTAVTIDIDKRATVQLHTPKEEEEEEEEEGEEEEES